VSKPVLQIIIASTRPGRIGLPVAQWFEQAARRHGGFEIEVIDLAEVALPFFDEPHHPRLQRYEHQHTKDWSETITRADAFVFVTPEYNYGFNAVLKNAIDFLNQEWVHKPVGFVSYGGVAGGTRAVQMLKQVVTSVKMVPVLASVNIPFVKQFLDDDERIQPNEIMTTSVATMLDELLPMAVALETLRKPQDY
jgi:NAD(P)H-dependent FMN reductase